MKNKNLIIALSISGIVLVLFLIGYLIISNLNKEEYTCTDYETNQTYVFKNEKEMHEVCDKFNGTEADAILSQYNIYNDLINNNDSSFNFYPYVDSNNQLAIIVSISNCENKDLAKEKAISWFREHSYNINDYQVDFEYPCEIE